MTQGPASAVWRHWISIHMDSRVIMYRFLWLLFYMVHAKNTNTTRVFKYVNNDQIVEDCENCLSKCCPGAQISLIFNNTINCVDNVFNVTKLEDYEVSIFNKDVKKKIIKTGKTLKSFRFVYSDVFEKLKDRTSSKSMEFYILEDGSKAVRKLNYLDQWPYPPWNYTTHCVEVQAISRNGIDVKSTRLIHRVIFKKKKMDNHIKDVIIASAMLISCLFLLLTLVAYGVLPQKRNLPALMLMALVSCLMTTFFFRAVQVFTEHVSIKKNVCTFVGLMLYYSLWASFTWMNVMSYDVWITTCNVYSQRWQPHSKILSKFCWYSTYGFGVPLLMAAFVIGIDYADLSAVPAFAKPHFVNSPYCYFETQNERRLYVNGPMLVTTIINICFFVMTARYICRNRAKPGGSGDSRNTKKDQNRFIIYLKLTIITGITWLLDVMGAFIDPEHWGWLVVDIFNSLSGFYIFYSFICKKEMIMQLCKRFKIETSFARQWESTVVTSVSVTKRQLSEKETTPTEQKLEFFSDKPGVN